MNSFDNMGGWMRPPQDGEPNRQEPPAQDAEPLLPDSLPAPDGYTPPLPGAAELAGGSTPEGAAEHTRPAQREGTGSPVPPAYATGPVYTGAPPVPPAHTADPMTGEAGGVPTQVAVAEPRPARGGRNWVLVSIAMLLVALVAGFGGGYLANISNSGRSTVMYRSPDTGTGLRSDTVNGTSLGDIAERASESVVSIVTENIVTNPFAGGEVQSGAGSGVIISEDGYILTNTHVISGADKVLVTLADGTELEAQVVGYDSASDIAVLKVNASGLVAAVIGDDTSMRVGDLVLAIGNPMGTLGNTVTDGIISAKDREVTIDGNTLTLLQMSAAVSPGNSGGGLFNADGELIGIVNAKSNGDNTEGLGFAIPISEAVSIAEDLIQLGYVSGRPALGVTVQYISSAESALQSGLSELGVYIVETTPGGAAQLAGLEAGDRIVSFNGQTINSSQELTSAIQRCEVGDTVEVEVSRGGVRHSAQVTLQEMQQPS